MITLYHTWRVWATAKERNGGSVTHLGQAANRIGAGDYSGAFSTTTGTVDGGRGTAGLPYSERRSLRCILSGSTELTEVLSKDHGWPPSRLGPLPILIASMESPCREWLMGRTSTAFDSHFIRFIFSHLLTAERHAVGTVSEGLLGTGPPARHITGFTRVKMQ